MVSYSQEDNMSNNFWNDENESVSEYELLEEAQEVEDIAEEYASQPVVVEAPEEALEQVAEESAYDLNHEESNIVYNAKLRLEQARLYDLLINHDLFDGVDADPNAISIVQNELKHYIVRRLEILLGIRQPEIKKPKEDLSSFNSLEVDFLKQLAHKGTFGQTAKVEPTKPKPLSSKPSQQGLRPIAYKAPQAPAPPKKKSQPKTKKAAPAPKSQEPQKPKKNNSTRPETKPKIKPSGHGRQLTMDEAMEIAKAELKEVQGKKAWVDMTQKEKKEEVKRVNEKYKRPRPENSAPFPTAQQLEMQYMTQQQRRGSSNSDKTAQFNEILATALANQKNNS